MGFERIYEEELDAIALTRDSLSDDERFKLVVYLLDMAALELLQTTSQLTLEEREDAL